MAREAIFIGYRRDDTADVAGRIFDALESRFGRDRLFKDVDSLRPGADFGKYIKTILPRCRVALILIGPNWANAQDEDGRRRLDDPHDWVRIEIEIALSSGGLDVVPVLVNGAPMPRAEELPTSLHPLLRRHAATIRRDPDFRDDIERLATALRGSVRTGLLDLGALGGERMPPPPPAQRSRQGNRMLLLIGGVLVAALALVAIGFGVSRWLPTRGAKTTDERTVTLKRAPQDGREIQQQQTRQPPEPAPVQETERMPVLSAGALPAMVRIPGRNFEVGRTEVTFSQWDACTAAGGCRGYRPRDKWGRGNHPVIYVDPDDAQAYVQWLSVHTGQRYRLLTSDEWESAARAGEAGKFSWGDEEPVCDLGARTGSNFEQCSRKTLAVGQFQANAYGLYDMHGNVSEWVEDREGSNRVLLGGSFLNDSTYLRSASRQSLPPAEGRTEFIGFRVARTL